MLARIAGNIRSMFLEVEGESILKQLNTGPGLDDLQLPFRERRLA